MNEKLNQFWICSFISFTSFTYTQSGEYYYAAKAFDSLERLLSGHSQWEGKRGACIGAFRSIIEGKQEKTILREIISILKNSSNDQADYVIALMEKW